MLSDDVAVSQFARDKSQLHDTLKSLSHNHSEHIECKDYDRACKTWQSHLDAIEEENATATNKECGRQFMEQRRFKKAAQLQIAQNDEFWQARVAEAEERWNEKRMALEDKHSLEMENLHRILDRKESLLHNPHSTFVRDMLRVERRLAEAHQYDDATLLRKKICIQEEQEKKNFVIAKQQKRKANEDRLLQKQKEEMEQLAKYIENERFRIEHRRENAHITSIQRSKNLQNDMSHAHRIELQRVKSSSVSLPPFKEKIVLTEIDARRKAGMPHGCRPGQAATYRGSHLLLRLVGKYPLPSLCELYDPEDPANENQTISRSTSKLFAQTM